jgi:hypothetical protein
MLPAFGQAHQPPAGPAAGLVLGAASSCQLPEHCLLSGLPVPVPGLMGGLGRWSWRSAPDEGYEDWSTTEQSKPIVGSWSRNNAPRQPLQPGAKASRQPAEGTIAL